MGRALYRKHRPKKLSEIIGQEHITDTLSNALKNQKISHAYLFTGPRGVGKTSIARILAYEVNKLPYDDEGTQMDIIEIDAASNRRIDEIRELKERVNIAPTSAKYKVYIIDEVHMLTKEAFNALLKTLEEPPEHVIFILATTEAHKVPDTIISRTQRFTFKPVDSEKVVDHLISIAKSEDIVIDLEALKLIANHGEGSFRDSISLLDQVRNSSDKITLSDIQKIIGQAPEDILTNVLKSVGSHDLQTISASLNELRSHGVQSSQIAKQLSAKIRDEIITNKLSIQIEDAISLLSELLSVSSASDTNIALELALYKIVIDDKYSSNTENGSKSLITEIPNTESKIPDPKTEIIIQPATESKQQSGTSNNKSTNIDLDNTSWQEVLSAIKTKQNTLYGIARMAVPKFEPGKLTLVLNFPFHLKRLNDTKNKQYIEDLIIKITGKNVKIECQLDNQLVNETPITPINELSNVDNLETISNIFGGAEIVE